jgi:hypothetical protein
MRESRLLASVLLLAACARTAPTESTEVARHFDALANAIAGCASTLRRCSEADDADSSACREGFLQCRGRAGETAEDSLAEAIEGCQLGVRSCAAVVESGDDARCDDALRACIGEVAGGVNGASSSAVTTTTGSPNPNPPIYQCFGQVRECVSAGDAPTECASRARMCLISAVGDLPRDRSRPVPADAGMREPDAAPPADSGSMPRPSQPVPPPAAGSGGPTVTPCAASYATCLENGEKAMKCMRELRMCEKK